MIRSVATLLGRNVRKKKKQSFPARAKCFEHLFTPFIKTNLLINHDFEM